jgi:anti-sigma factor RsiW
MTPCPTGEELSAYHDGRIVGTRLELIQSHVADCQPCGLELSRLSAMSRLFATAVRPRLSQIARHRLHENVDLAMERGLIRFGWTLSGIAASILVVGSALLMHVGSTTYGGASRQTAEAAPPWLGVAANSYADSLVVNARTPAAALYLADATSDSSNPDSIVELP